MASSYLVTIPKAGLKLKRINDFITGIFVDNSGSTCSQLVSISKTVLQAELSICKATKFDHVVLWNTTATLCTNTKAAKPEGGTQPTAIFRNEQTKQAFVSSDVIVFVTDGEIDDKSVTQFATYTKDNLNKALVICVIVHKRLVSPSQINVSVVAPSMMALNVLCLFYDGERFYILSSKGYISRFYQPSNDFSDYSKMSTLNIHDLFHNVEISEHRKIPDGCIPIRDAEKEIVAIDFNQLLSTTDLESVVSLTEDDWKTLIQYGKIGNKLDELRTFVSHMKTRSVQLDMENCKTKFEFRYSKQRDEVIARIVALKPNEADHASELSDLRQQPCQISD